MRWNENVQTHWKCEMCGSQREDSLELQVQKCSKSLDQGLKGKKSCPNWAMFRSLKRFQKTLQQFVVAWSKQRYIT
jgi:hypothetical protein